MDGDFVAQILWLKSQVLTQYCEFPLACCYSGKLSRKILGMQNKSTIPNIQYLF